MKWRLALVLVLIIAACGGTATQASDVPIGNDRPDGVTTSSTTAAPEDRDEIADDQSGVSDLADRTRPLGSALLQPPSEPLPVPVGLVIDSIGITSAPVIDVGVEPNGEMEIPGASQVGWYRFGPTPGENGSAVLAAHIAFNGRDGVFRDLDVIEVGAVVEIDYDDGSSKRFEITETAQYAKDELPVDRIFAKDGAPELTLITCGGDFNRSLRSYSDNVVAYAVPLDS